MKSLSEVSLTEFKEALTPSSIRVFQILYFGLAAGVLLFLLVVLVLYLNHKGDIENYEMVSTLNIMTLMNLLLTIMMIFIGKAISEKQFSKSNLENAVYGSFKDKNGRPLQHTPAQKCLGVIRTSSILRMATLEGSAFFGLVISILAIQSGVGIAKPVYFVNALSALPILIYILFTFPTAEKLEEIFARKIQNVI